MTAHTPGPWEVRHFDGAGVFAVNNPAGSDGTQYPIVDFGAVGGARAPQFAHYGTPEANARLIASAPELLDALRAAAIALAHAANGDRTYEPAYQQVSAAIAKATGASA